MNEGSEFFLGLHPYSDHNVIAYGGNDATKHFADSKLWLNEVQSYRTDERGDHTFDRQVLPMVAWHGKKWDNTGDEPKLDFHTLAGLVRLQFYNRTGSNQQIKSITLTATDPGTVTGKAVKGVNLCGLFTVKAQHTDNPMLAYTDATGVADPKTLTLKRADDAAIDFPQNELKSFYAVLPALVGQDSTTVYRLTITVTNASDETFSGTVAVNTRRRGITYLQAIGIKKFDASADRAERGLVGNGTDERPFKIYTEADMMYLRDCFNNPDGGVVRVNGQEVTSATQFRIMRSDIVLQEGDDHWGEGAAINNFRGVLKYLASTPSGTVPGLTNNTAIPLFAAIQSGGTVDGITVRYNSDVALAVSPAGERFSPLCVENYGIIRNCRITTVEGSAAISITPPTSVGYFFFGGICAYNHSGGTIEDCGTMLRCSFNEKVEAGGICGYNSAGGVVKGCYASSKMNMQGSLRAGGIVNINYGTVSDSYFASHIDNTGTTPWGGIVYSNSGAIEHCAIDSAATKLVSTSTNEKVWIGGIVCENLAGTIDYCWCSAQLGAPNVGGIVGKMSGGTVRNCFVNDKSRTFTVNTVSTDHYGGGLVGQLSDGTVENSYTVMSHFVLDANDHKYLCGSVVGNMSGGTVTNVYGLCVGSSLTLFYGQKSGGTLTTDKCHLVKKEQDGVKHWTYDDNATTGLGALQSTLSTDKGTGKDWKKGTGTQDTPYLEAYTKTPSTLSRRHR